MKKIAFACIILGCYLVSYYFPMWNFTFIAPQYPHGLRLEVFLTGARGDVFEIDIINHYIGMSKLEHAAVTERLIAPYVLLLLALFSLLVTFLSSINKWIRLAMSAPVLGFPIVFTGTFYFWLYQFGHNLNPAAPVEIAPFTPTIIGTGIIGQFRTFAIPGLGFYACTIAAILLFFIVKKDLKGKTIKSESGAK